MHRKLRQLALGGLALAAPAAAFAQPTGSVITGPLAVGAPALGWPVLVVLAVALAAGAIVMLRVPRSAARVAAALALVLAAGAGRAAVLSVIISGDECHRITQETYSPLTEALLENQCNNSIRVIDLQLDCLDGGSEEANQAAPVPACEVGLILASGDLCELPICLD